MRRDCHWTVLRTKIDPNNLWTVSAGTVVADLRALSHPTVRVWVAGNSRERRLFQEAPTFLWRLRLCRPVAKFWLLGTTGWSNHRRAIMIGPLSDVSISTGSTVVISFSILFNFMAQIGTGTSTMHDLLRGNGPIEQPATRRGPIIKEKWIVNCNFSRIIPPLQYYWLDSAQNRNCKLRFLTSSSTRTGCYLGKLFCKQFSRSSPSPCLPGQQGKCRTTVELSENILQNLMPKWRPILQGVPRLLCQL